MAFVGDVYIADSINFRVRKVTISTGIITTIAGGGSTASGNFGGDGGAATSATLDYTYGVAVDASGTYIAYFICDSVDHTYPRQRVYC